MASRKGSSKQLMKVRYCVMSEMPNQSLQPTAGRSDVYFNMASIMNSAAKLAPAIGG
jgi:hypothetical protein